MTDIVDEKKHAYPVHRWGALAADPWMQIASPASARASRLAALRAWLADGGSEEDFNALCDDARHSSPGRRDFRR